MATVSHEGLMTRGDMIQNIPVLQTTKHLTDNCALQGLFFLKQNTN